MFGRNKVVSKLVIGIGIKAAEINLPQRKTQIRQSHLAAPSKESFIPRPYNRDWSTTTRS
jgi:hypothetical protein